MKHSFRDESSSLDFVPPDADRNELANAAQRCQACDLYKHATRAVFGEGPTPAKIMLIGEQPGDREDLAGRPFVGPAGKLLDEALSNAQVVREHVYVTNTVKHFKWEPRGKRRIHSKPNAGEVRACQAWLEAELALVQPEVIVCLGATAAQLFLGRTFRLTKGGGVLHDGEPWARWLLATYHPSALVRMHNDEKAFERIYHTFVRDLAEAGAAASLRRERRASSRRHLRVAPAH